MKKVFSSIGTVVLFPLLCMAQAISTVTPGGADVAQQLPVAISCQGDSFLDYINQGSFTTTVSNLSRIFLRRGATVVQADSLRVPSSVQATVSFSLPAQMQTGGWDVVAEHVGGKTVEKANGFTVAAPTAPVITSIAPASATWKQQVTVTISGSHTHFKFVPATAAVTNIKSVWLSRGATKIAATGVTVSNSLLCKATFTIPDGCEPGKYAITVEQDYGRPPAVLDAAFLIDTIKTAPTLAASYLFSGNAQDESGNGNHLTVFGAKGAADRFGNPNAAYWFDGIDDYMVCETLNGFPAGDAAKSISVWFKSGSISSKKDKLLAGFGSSSGQSGGCFQIGHYSGGWRINGYGDDYDWKTGITNPDYLDTIWHHCVVTYDGTWTKLYMDGTMKSSTKNFRYNSVCERIIVSKEIFLPGWWFHGCLDDIAFYGKALTEQEIRDLYESTGKNAVSLIEIGTTYNPRPVFSWHRVDSAASYTIKIDTTPAFANPLATVPTGDTSYTPTFDLPADTIYWRVATNTNQQSLTSHFIIQDKRVPMLVPYAPDVTLERRPEFRWHPVATASSYTLVVAATANFSNAILTVPLPDTGYKPLSDLPAGTIYWKVKSNLVETFSEPDWFIIQADSLPFLYRFGGATVATPTPSFAWKPVSGATGYKLQIDTVKSFAAPVISLPLADTIYRPNVPLASNTYYWRVSSSKDLALFSPFDSVAVKVTSIAKACGPATDRRIHITGNGRGGTLTVTASGAGVVRIIDVRGRIVRSVPFSGGTVMLPLAGHGIRDLGPGVYFVHVATDNERVTRRFRFLP